MFQYLFTKTPLVFLVQPLWRDEAFSYLLAKKNIFQILVLSAKDFSPPLYYLILHFWMKIFGSSEIALRSLSFVFFWATLYIVYLFLFNIFKFSLKKSFFYLLFFLINQLLLYYAFEARMYLMFAFFATLSFYSLYKKDFKLYLLSTILGLYTHYFMILILVSQYFVSKNKNQLRAFLIFVPWLFLVLFQKGIVVGSFWIKKFDYRLIINFIGQLYTGYENTFIFFEKSISWFSLVLIILFYAGYLIIKMKTRQFKLFKYLLIWSVGIPLLTVIVSFIKPIFLPRYLIFSTVGLILLISYIIEHLPKISRWLIIFLLMITTLNYNKLQIEKRQKTDFRKASHEVKALIKKNDSLYATSELDFFVLEYYFPDNKVYLLGKNYDEIPDYVGKILIPKNQIIKSLPYYPRKAFVFNSDGSYQIQALY